MPVNCVVFMHFSDDFLINRVGEATLNRATRICAQVNLGLDPAKDILDNVGRDESDLSIFRFLY